MSWSANFIGTPEKVAAALEAQSVKLSGQSKIEYDDALPHLMALVKQNFVTPAYAEKYHSAGGMVIELNASGSGTASHGSDMVTQEQRNCTVTLKQLYGALV